MKEKATCKECGELLLSTQLGRIYCPTWNCKGDQDV